MKINIPAALGCLGLAIAFSTAVTRSSELSAEPAVSLPAPAIDPPAAGNQVAIFAGGCFWGVQGVFEHVKGVRLAVAGYAGGPRAAAHYETVSDGTTGHAESVRIVYDPKQVSYGTLLRIYFSVVADPTTFNFQGPDHGTQYRSAIFPTTPQQKQVAQSYIAQLDKAHSFPAPIVTRIESGSFYPAEAYHQDFLVRKPDYPYIRMFDMPKLTALKRLFPGQYNETPVVVNARA
jgi:peptide-methionine (S)-S-oxide reductase